MEFFLSTLLPLAAAAVLIVLILGLWTMLKGNDANRSQRLMRARVALQGVAVVVAMALLYFFQR